MKILLGSIALALLIPAVRAAEPDTLTATLRELQSALEKHDWLQVLDWAESSHRQAQTGDMGIDHAQYVAELLGLHYAFNNIKGQGASPSSPKGLRRLLGQAAPAPAEGRVTQADLNQIRSVRWTKETGATVPGWRRVTGTATLRNGRVLDLEAHFVKEGGAWKLTGAVG